MKISELNFICNWKNGTETLEKNVLLEYKDIGGVYVLFNHDLKKVYIGSSKDLVVRWQRHLREGIVKGEGSLPLYKEKNQIHELQVFKKSLLPSFKANVLELRVEENKYTNFLRFKYSGYRFYNSRCSVRECCSLNLRTMLVNRKSMTMAEAGLKLNFSTSKIRSSMEGNRCINLRPYIFINVSRWFKPVVYKVIVLKDYDLGVSCRYITCQEIKEEKGMSKSRIYYSLRTGKRIMKKQYRARWGFIVVCCGLIIVI